MRIIGKLSAHPEVLENMTLISQIKSVANRGTTVSCFAPRLIVETIQTGTYHEWLALMTKLHTSDSVMQQAVQDVNDRDSHGPGFMLTSKLSKT